MVTRMANKKNKTYLVNEIDDSVIDSTVNFETLLQHLPLHHKKVRYSEGRESLGEQNTPTFSGCGNVNNINYHVPEQVHIV